MSSLDDLKELDQFDKFKSFIKDFFIEREDLFRLVWFSNSNPFDEISCPYPDSPYQLFIPSSSHGCVLFRRKNDVVLSEECVNVIIDFQSIRKGSSYFLDDIYIIIRVVTKGSNIQELENGINRSHAIMKLIDNNLNCARVSNIGDVRRESYKELSLNEENVGYIGIYTGTVIGNDLLEEANS